MLTIDHLFTDEAPWITHEGMGILTPDLFHELIQHPEYRTHSRTYDAWHHLLNPMWDVAPHGFHIENYFDALESYPTDIYPLIIPSNFVFVNVPKRYPTLRAYQATLLQQGSISRFQDNLYDHFEHLQAHIIQASHYLQHSEGYDLFWAFTIWFNPVPNNETVSHYFFEQYPTPLSLYEDEGYSEGFTWQYIFQHRQTMPKHHQAFHAFHEHGVIPVDGWTLFTLADALYHQYNTETWWSIIFHDLSYSELLEELSYDQFSGAALFDMLTPYLQQIHHSLQLPLESYSEILFP